MQSLLSTCPNAIAYLPLNADRHNRMLATLQNAIHRGAQGEGLKSIICRPGSRSHTRHSMPKLTRSNRNHHRRCVRRCEGRNPVATSGHPAGGAVGAAIGAGRNDGGKIQHTIPGPRGLPVASGERAAGSIVRPGDESRATALAHATIVSRS